MAKLITIADYEEHAYQSVPKPILDFYTSGANQEQTLNDNRQAFKQWRLLPRVLRNVSSIDMTCKIFGQNMKAPLGISPSARQRLAHPDGECAAAKAAEEHGVVYILSTVSTCSIEEVAAAAPNAIKWFQLYVMKERSESLKLIRRAEKAGFKALCVTVDVPVVGLRIVDMKNGLILPANCRTANFSVEAISTEHEEDQHLYNQLQKLFDPSLDWEAIAWLRKATKLPIVIKGIMTPQDAELAIKYGAAAVFVSNHGGRQLDGVPATIDALPGIVAAVKKRCPVFIDGGVTQGTDVLKALALGADMVCFGRPLVYGLAHSGQSGASHVLQIFKNELCTAMALTGCKDLAAIKREMVIRQERFLASL